VKPIAVITGASSGFGEAIAHQFAKAGWNLILLARREERLTSLSNLLHQTYQADSLIFACDVRNLDEVESVYERIPIEWKNFEALINNAGLAVGKESLDQGDIDDWNRMIDTNIKGLIFVTRTFVRSMINQKKGTIINVGSIAGKEVYPGGNVYSATKSAVDALTRSMRIDFLEYNIRVGQIAPGAAETEFSIVRFKGDNKKADAVYSGYQALQAQDIADAVMFMVSRPAHVCINDMIIMPAAQATATLFNKKNL
jgi:NADP-dependent 3-hydroxy acid dehydrogenase YdfG